jgi:hypothetical protein
MVHSLPTPDTGKNFRFLIRTVGWDDEGDVLADSFLWRIAKQSLCPVVPTRDDAIEVFADNCIIRGIHDGGQQTRSALGSPANCDVPRDGKLNDLPILLTEWDSACIHSLTST